MSEPLHINNPTSLIAAVPSLVNLPFEKLRGSVVFVLFTDDGSDGALSLGCMRVNLPTDYDTIESWWREVLGLFADIDRLDLVKIVVFAAGDSDDMIGGGVLGCAAAFDHMVDLDLDCVGIVGDDGYRLQPDEQPRPLSLITLFDEDFPAPTPTVTEWPEPTHEQSMTFALETLTSLSWLSQVQGDELDPTDQILTDIEEQSISAAARAALLVTGDRGMQGFLLSAGWGAELGHLHYTQVTSGRTDIAEVDEPILAAIAGLDFPRPNGDRLRQAICLIETAVTQIPSDARHAQLTTLAFLHWFLGESSAAHQLTVAALDSGDSLGAKLLHQTIDSGHLPDWAKRSTPITEVGLAWVSRVS